MSTNSELRALWSRINADQGASRGRVQSTIAARAGGVMTHTDDELGMAWFNSLTETERAKWLRCANSAVPADAWTAFKAQRTDDNRFIQSRGAADRRQLDGNESQE